MLFCLVDLPATPLRAGALRRVPLQVIGTPSYVKDVTPGFLARLHLESVPIEMWDMLTPDQRVLVKVGTIHADRAVRWRKS